MATLTPGHSVDLVFAGVAGDQFMAHNQVAIFFGKISDLPEPRPGRGEAFTVAATPYERSEESTAGNALFATDLKEAQEGPSKINQSKDFQPVALAVKLDRFSRVILRARRHRGVHKCEGAVRNRSHCGFHRARGSDRLQRS